MDFFHDCSESLPPWIDRKNSRSVCSITSRNRWGTWIWQNQWLFVSYHLLANAICAFLFILFVIILKIMYKARSIFDYFCMLVANCSKWIFTYFDVIISVIMQIQHAIDFTIATNMKVIRAFNSFADCLSCIFLHLYIIKFTVGKKKMGMIRELCN